MKHARNNSNISNKNRVNILEEYVNQVSGDVSQISNAREDINCQHLKAATVHDLKRNNVKEEIMTALSSIQNLGHLFKGLEGRVTALETQSKLTKVDVEQSSSLTKEILSKFLKEELEAFSIKVQESVADVYQTIKNSEEQISVNLEESSTLFKIDINHLNNQIKRVDQHLNELLSISVNDKSNDQYITSNKQVMREGIYESFTNGDIVSLNSVIQESNRFDELFRKHSRTEKVIEEILKQLNLTKRNLASFKDESTKIANEYSNQMRLHLQRFNIHEAKIVKDLEAFSDKLSILKKENSGLKLKIQENETEIKDTNSNVNLELKQIYEKLSKISKEQNDHVSTFDITVKAIWDSFGLLSDSINSNS